MAMRGRSPGREMDAAVSQLSAEDSQERIAAVRRLQQLLEKNHKGLSATDVGTLLNATVDLLRERDHEVCQGALQVLASAASLASERLQLDFMALLPAIADRLGDEKQSVRDAGRGLILALMQIFSPTVILERLGSHALRHGYWKVREEFVRILGSAIRLFSEKELPVLRLLLPVVMDLMEDTNCHVKEATMTFLEKLYQQRGLPLKDEIQSLCLRPGQLEEINTRLGRVDSKMCTCGPKARRSSTPGGTRRKQSGPGSEKNSSPSFQVEVHLEGSKQDGVSMTIREPARAVGNQPTCCAGFQCDDEPCCNPDMRSLDETLAESLSKSADWSVRVGAFGYIQKLLNEGCRRVPEVLQCFDSIMKLLQEHVSDPHYKVSQAALSCLNELMKTCKKEIGSHLDLLLPLLFPRLVDVREETCELAASALQAIGNSYDIKMLFPAILRSIDEQRSPKGKVAVIEYAIGAFVKLEFNFEVISQYLRLWLAKLVRLFRTRHAKLKETALMGVIAVYSHLDTIFVLEFILAMPVEDQTCLRRSLKQYVPQIEVDLIYHMRFRSHRVPLVTMEESEVSALLKKPYMHVFPMVKSCDKSPPNPDQVDRSGVHEAMLKELHYNCRTPQNTGDPTTIGPKIRDYNTGWDLTCDKTRRWLGCYNNNNAAAVADAAVSDTTPLLKPDSVITDDTVTHMLTERMLLWGPGKPAAEKHEAILAAAQLYQSNDTKVWPQYFDKLINTVLEAAKDKDRFTRQLALSIIPHVLNQIARRLPEDILVAKLPTVLPALLDAFKHQHEDVRKAVLFCLVDIYVVMGKDFLPYLSDLNGTQLQLVTTYASRMSQLTEMLQGKGGIPEQV